MEASGKRRLIQLIKSIKMDSEKLPTTEMTHETISGMLLNNLFETCGVPAKVREQVKEECLMEVQIAMLYYGSIRIREIENLIRSNGLLQNGDRDNLLRYLKEYRSPYDPIGKNPEFPFRNISPEDEAELIRISREHQSGRNTSNSFI